MITLCCAPDWMKGGRSGSTDWSQLETAPTPDHYGDFAKLAAVVAQRYPTVRRFQVWNELKGFYDSTTNAWDAAAFTTFYNAVYDAVKQVRPDAQVGGPYVVLSSGADAAAMSDPSTVAGPWGVLDQRPLDVITYWLAHRHGGDFLAVDASTTTTDGRLTTDEFTALDKFRAAAAWLRTQTDLPIVWSEWYVQPKDAGWTLDHQAAVMTQALMTFAGSGAGLALLWQPEATNDGCQGCLWTAPGDAGGATATAFADAYATFARLVPPGTETTPVTVSDATVGALATPTALLLVNRTDHDLVVRAEGHDVELSPWQVATLTRAG
jgi:hypothetical protein